MYIKEIRYYFVGVGFFVVYILLLAGCSGGGTSMETLIEDSSAIYVITKTDGELLVSEIWMDDEEDDNLLRVGAPPPSDDSYENFRNDVSGFQLLVFRHSDYLTSDGRIAQSKLRIPKNRNLRMFKYRYNEIRAMVESHSNKNEPTGQP
jgi:hypothetical protein